MEDNPVPLTLSSALQSLSVTNPDSPSPSHHEHHSASPNPRPPSSQSKPLHVNSLPPPIENPNPTTEAPDVVMTNPGGEESAVAMEVDNVDASQSSAENNPQQPSPASSTSPIHADATPATATTTAASSENKPKGKGKPRTKPAAPPTPPAEPAAPPPRPTVRLNIPLGGPTNYSVSILELARDTGQRPPTPPPVRRDSVSGSDDDSEPDEDANTNEGKKKKNTGLSTRKRAKLAKEKAEAAEYYDLDDPFIDDSDLGVDAPTHFAQTKQKGFYVSSGEVQLVKDEAKAAAKAAGGIKKKRPRLPQPSNMSRFRPGFKSTSASKPKSSSSAGQAALAPAGGSNSTAPSEGRATPTPNGQHQRSGSPTSSARGLGTRDSPIALYDSDAPSTSSAAPKTLSALAEELQKHKDGEKEGGPPSKKQKMNHGGGMDSVEGSVAGDSNETGGTGKKRKKHENVDPSTFHPELQAEFEILRGHIAREPFEPKSKFPPTLRQPLLDASLKAIHLNEFNETFFDYLPEIFPYNRFTMQKLTRRLVFQPHLEFIEKKQETLLAELQKVSQAGFAAAKAHHDEAVQQWDQRQERKKAMKEEDSTAPAIAAEEGGTGGKKTRDDNPPVQKYRWTEEIKNLIWELVANSNDMASITNTMAEWDTSVAAVSDQGLRKVLYQKIVNAFPEGWMTTTIISREVSTMKKKFLQDFGDDEE